MMVDKRESELTPDGQKLADALQRSHEGYLAYLKTKSRIGVKFTSEQEVRIREYVANNETLQAQRVILDKLKEEFEDTDGE